MPEESFCANNLQPIKIDEIQFTVTAIKIVFSLQKYHYTIKTIFTVVAAFRYCANKQQITFCFSYIKIIRVISDIRTHIEHSIHKK